MRQSKTSGRWGQNEQAEQHYLVEPRHLAGGGDLRHVTEYLRAAGWKDRSKTGGPLVFDSPDRTLRLGYDPFTQPGGWTIRAKATRHQDAWHVTLGQQTPVEIVAGFTDALTLPRSAHAPNVWAPLEEQRWSTNRNPHVTSTSPDGSAFVQYHQTGPGQALWWAGAGTEHGPSWNATFTPSTPMHLIQSFTAALADPLPVMRPRGHVPTGKRIRTQSVSVLPSELGAWQQARINAGRTAAWARNTWATTRPHQNAPGLRNTASSAHTPR